MKNPFLPTASHGGQRLIGSFIAYDSVMLIQYYDTPILIVAELTPADWPGHDDLIIFCLGVHHSWLPFGMMLENIPRETLQLCRSFTSSTSFNGEREEFRKVSLSL